LNNTRERLSEEEEEEEDDVDEATFTSRKIRKAFIKTSMNLIKALQSVTTKKIDST